MASDKVANIREPLIVLSFGIKTNEGRKSQIVELNKSQMDTFVDVLETASKVSDNIIVCRGLATPLLYKGLHYLAYPNIWSYPSPPVSPFLADYMIIPHLMC